MKRDLNLFMTLLLQTAFMGFFGSCFALLTILRYAFYARNSVEFADWLESLFPEDEQRDSEQLYQRIAFGLDDKSDEYVEPFQDLMIYGSTINKQMIIARVTRYFRPAFTPVLKIALKDPNNIIRVQAAASIAKIEDEFFNRYQERHKWIEHTPDNYTKNMQFAITCEEYAKSGILGEKRCLKIIEDTIATLKHCIELNPTDDNPKFIIGNMYLISGRNDQAYAVMKELVDASDFLIPEVMKTYSETLFKCKRYQELRDFCKQFTNGKRNNLLPDEEFDELCNVWAGGLTKPKMY